MCAVSCVCCELYIYLYVRKEETNLFLSFHNLLNKRTNLVLARHFSMLHKAYNMLKKIFCKGSLIFPSQLEKIYFILCIHHTHTHTILFCSLYIVSVDRFPSCNTICVFFIHFFLSNLINYTAFIYSFTENEAKEQKIMFPYKRKLKVDCSEN